MKLKHPMLLIFSFGFVFLTAFIGSSATGSNIATWYVLLKKPPFNPPNWVFGPVWTVLYILMTISLYRVWRKGFKKKEIKTAVILFFVNLFLNALWSITFFGLKNVSLAIVVIIALLLSIIVLIRKFSVIDKVSSKLLIPYALWVSFATILNFSIWILNK